MIQQKDISIDQSLALYEEGQKIISLLSKELENAESKVEKIVKVGK